MIKIINTQDTMRATNSYNELKNEYQKAHSWGLSTHIDLKGCDIQIIKNKKKLAEFTNTLCKLLKVNKFGPTTLVKLGKYPELYGYSMMQLIETSSLTGHFVEANGNVYIDIFSCRLYNPHTAKKFCDTFFKAKSSTMKVLIRK